MKDIPIIQYHFRTAPLVLAGEAHACGDVLDWFRLGVRAYMYSELGTEELFRCIDQVTKGGRYIGLDLLDTILSKLSLVKNNFNGVSTTLSPKELLVAQALSEGLRVVEISEKFGNKASTISTIKKKVYRKLGVTRSTQLYQLMQAYELGHSGE